MKRLIFSFVAFLAASSAFALELGSPFVDGAVLPREKPVRVAAIYRPHAVFKDLKSSMRPRFGQVFDGRKTKTLAAEARLAASAGLDAFVFAGDPREPTFVAAVEAFLKVPEKCGMRFAVQCDAARRGDVPSDWLASPDYWRENGKPRVFDETLRTLAVGPTANHFEQTVKTAPTPVVIDAWNDYRRGRKLIPDYHAGDACDRLGIACELVAPGLPTKATPFARLKD